MQGTPLDTHLASPHHVEETPTNHKRNTKNHSLWKTHPSNSLFDTNEYENRSTNLLVHQ